MDAVLAAAVGTGESAVGRPSLVRNFHIPSAQRKQISQARSEKGGVRVAAVESLREWYDVRDGQRLCAGVLVSRAREVSLIKRRRRGSRSICGGRRSREAA